MQEKTVRDPCFAKQGVFGSNPITSTIYFQMFMEIFRLRLSNPLFSGEGEGKENNHLIFLDKISCPLYRRISKSTLFFLQKTLMCQPRRD
ncbi:MAG: hypothetical protein ACRD1R_09980 [Acidobacteriota bacterium]